MNVTSIIMIVAIIVIVLLLVLVGAAVFASRSSRNQPETPPVNKADNPYRKLYK